MPKFCFNTTPQRSRIMAAIRSKDTRPERTVRALLRNLGYSGYRLHRRDLPGNPDVVFIGRRKVILVNGCFWHGHSCQVGAKVPKTNRDYWLEKIDQNRKRDAEGHMELQRLGWSVLTIWECELSDIEATTSRLSAFMGGAE